MMQQGKTVTSDASTVVVVALFSLSVHFIHFTSSYICAERT